MTENRSRKLAAIMFADIVSYSRLMGSNEGEALKLLKDFENISTKIINETEQLVICGYPIRDLDRLMSFYLAAKNAGRYLVIDINTVFSVL